MFLWGNIRIEGKLKQKIFQERLGKIGKKNNPALSGGIV